MSKREIVKFFEEIKKSKGTIFSCHFIKRTTGKLRKMVCRLGVKKGIKGIGLKYSPIKKQLATVYDLQKRNFRSIPLNAIVYLKVKGNEVVNIYA